MLSPDQHEYESKIKTLKTPRGLNKYYPEFYKFLKENYPDCKQITEAAYRYYRSIDKIPNCPVCGNVLKFKNYFIGYGEFCSQKCARLGTRKKAEQTKKQKYGGNGVSQETIEKRKKTCMRKYGGNGVSQETIEKRKKTCMRKYGVNHPCQAPHIQRKIHKTIKERYGVEHALQNKSVLNKSIQTSIEHFGTKHPMQSSKISAKVKNTLISRYGGVGAQSNKIKKKIKNTNNKKYGVDWGIASADIREKIKQTNLKKYGVENVFSSQLVKDKIAATNLKKYGAANPGGVLGGVKGRTYSILSQKFFNELDNIFKKYTTQYATKGGEFIINYKNRSYCIDYYVSELNLCIEFQGDYYHANPLYYDPDDLVFHDNMIKAQQIWGKDDRRKRLLESLGYKVIIMWESDYKQCDDLSQWLQNKLKNINMQLKLD